MDGYFITLKEKKRSFIPNCLVQLHANKCVYSNYKEKKNAYRNNLDTEGKVCYGNVTVEQITKLLVIGPNAEKRPNFLQHGSVARCCGSSVARQNSSSFGFSHLAAALNVLTLWSARIRLRQTCQCSQRTPPGGREAKGRERRPSVNEVLVELPEGAPGDPTRRRMMAAIVPSDSSI